MNEASTGPGTRFLETRTGGRYRLPLFLPVYEHRAPFIGIPELVDDFSVEGIITNAFLLYKKREIRSMLLERSSIKEYYGFHGLLVTDSGAYQRFRERVSNLTAKKEAQIKKERESKQKEGSTP